MRALFLTEPERYGVDIRPDPEPGPGQVLVRVRACGICGTDLHIVAGQFPRTPFPIIPGHETAGVVAAIGPDVTNVLPGDHVGLDAALWCGVCVYCRGGARHVCPQRGGVGGTIDGGFAELVVAPVANCFQVPSHVPFREAAVAEPLSCVLHGLSLLRPVFRPTVLVIGAGTMGLLSLQAAINIGAARVDLANRNPKRRAMGTVFGANRLLAIDQISECYDIVIEATGYAPLVRVGLDALAPRGQLLLLGVSGPQDEVSVSPFSLYNDELTVVASMGALDTYQQAVDAIASGAVQVAPLLGEAYSLDDFSDALADVAAGQSGKVHIIP